MNESMQQRWDDIRLPLLEELADTVRQLEKDEDLLPPSLAGGDLGMGADTLSGGAGNDRLVGASGEDVLSGGEGDDVLLGGRGDDVLSGGAGDDRLDGFFGLDMITGGPGADVFVLEADFDADETGDADENDVMDFADGEDSIEIEGVGTLAEVNIAATDEGTLIGVAGASLLLRGVDAALIDEADIALPDAEEAMSAMAMGSMADGIL